MFERLTLGKSRKLLHKRSLIHEAQTPPVQKSGEVSHDQVTLKSAGQPDNDGDRR